ASICAITKELTKATPINLERALRIILGEDLSLALDQILLDNVAADSIRPAGLRAGVAPLTAASGGGLTTPELFAADLKALCSAIPPLKPVLILNPVQWATVAAIMPGLPVVQAAALPVGTAIALDVAAFANALGVPEFATSEEPVIHESDAALPLIGGT